MAALIFAVGSTDAALAQQSLWLDVTTSSAQPPSTVTGASAENYLMVGLRGEASNARWDLSGSADYGNGFSADAGRWGSFDATATRNYTAHTIGFAFNTTLSGLQYTTPFSYGAYSAMLWPELSVNATSFTLRFTPQATAGFWSSSGQTGNISVLGSSLALAHDFANVTAELSAEAHRAINGSSNGTFKGIGLDLSTSIGAFDFDASAKSWRTPNGNEWGYDFSATRNLGEALQIDLDVARSTTDPTLATPGSFGASLGFSWRLANHIVRVPPVQHAAERGVAAANGRRVHFSVTLPSAKSVAVSGSFTDWKPVPMSRQGNEFSVDLVVPIGTHQYGFLVDGENWYVPPTASGIVDDGFGRKDATLVIEKP